MEKAWRPFLSSFWCWGKDEGVGVRACNQPVMVKYLWEERL